MRNTILAVLLFGLLSVAEAYSQAKKPTLMVVPDDVWCTENGYTISSDNQGQNIVVPDYERALRENRELANTITKVNELMTDRGFPLKDLGTVVRNIRQTEAEDAMTMSRTSGATLSETPLDKLYNRAKADIVLQLGWSVNEIGPKRSVTYSLKGVDSYTGKQVAASSGTGPQSFSAEIPVLLEEAVIERMDNFTAQLQDHFDDMVANGREIILTVKTFTNGPSFEDDFDGEELTDVIDNWMSQNTVNHRYSLSDASETTLHFEQVRIPLYRENGSAMDARAFSNTLRKFLQKPPYNITCKILTKGLGRADVILGEK